MMLHKTCLNETIKADSLSDSRRFWNSSDIVSLVTTKKKAYIFHMNEILTFWKIIAMHYVQVQNRDG